MAFFVLDSEITITTAAGKVFQFSGVNNVVIHRSIHTLNQSATLTLPSVCVLMRNGQAVSERLSTAAQFGDGDAITILLGYNGDLKEEFRGFVKRRQKGMPLEVECEGYVRKLRLGVSITKNFNNKKTSAKELLELACKGTGIKVQCDVDIPLTGITLIKADGVRIVDYIKKACEGIVTIFFIEPDVLWCGLVYGAYATATGAGKVFGLPMVKYRPGLNCLDDNSLRERVPNEPVQVILQGKYATGEQVFTKSKANNAKSHMKSLNTHVPDAKVLTSIAQEKEYMNNYTGLEGKINGFLQPFALPGYDAQISHRLYPELEGIYVIEGTTVTFGVNGARRVCEIGPRVGFDK